MPTLADAGDAPCGYCRRKATLAGASTRFGPGFRVWALGNGFTLGGEVPFVCWVQDTGGAGRWTGLTGAAESSFVRIILIVGAIRMSSSRGCAVWMRSLSSSAWGRCRGWWWLPIARGLYA